MEDVERPGLVHDELPIPAVSDEIWKLILDRTRVPESLIHMLKGEVWAVSYDKENNPVGKWEKRGESLMNEAGIRFFTPLIYSTVTPDKLATFLTEDEVNRMTREMMETIVQIIHEKGDEFEIPASNRSYVTRLLEQNYFLSLTASRKGTILEALKPMYERREIYTPQQKRRGLGLPTFLGGGD